MILYKKGVDIRGIRAETVIGIMICGETYSFIANSDCVVTSVCDGKHKKGSLHFVGLAADIRIWNVNNKINLIFDELKRRLIPLGFDIILEKDHFHIEYQPDLLNAEETEQG